MSLKDIRPALRAFLMGDAGISAAIGAARIYPVKMPQGVTQDSIVYTRISGQGDHHNEGPSGLNRPRIQIDCYSLSQDSAVALADRVKRRLDGYKDVMGSGSNAVAVQGVFFDNERETYDDATKLYGVSRDYFLWYEER